ncbi:uncharacterized protein V6R79_014794 [Siganus canaliculatus]
MSPSASLLLLLLLGLCQANPVPKEEQDHVDISAQILATNNATSEILVEGDMVVPKHRNALKCWYQSCLWQKSADGFVTIPYTISAEFQTWERQKIEYDTNNLNTPYDYSSIMHYGKTAFSVQYGRDSITPIPDSNVMIGQRQAMSYWDIMRINLLYGC